MKAYVTSIGEPTTELCCWALERNGFEIVLLEGKATLWQKLRDIYFMAGEEFVRIDADVIVNKNFTPKMLDWLENKDKDIWWWQFETFDWFKLDLNHSIGYIKKEAIPELRNNIHKFDKSNRPETEMSRIRAFHDPRRFDTYRDELMGLHGFRGDLERTKKLKHIRNQQHLYDFEMAERLNSL